MFKIFVQLEDTKITAESGEGANWEVKLEGYGEEPATRVWSSVQLAAVLALAIGAENGSPVDEAAYPIAEEACKGLRPELRPMP